MKKNVLLTGLAACCLSLSLSTAADAMGGFEDDLGHVNFNIGIKSIGDDYQVSNPPTEVEAIPVTGAASPSAEQVGTATYKIPGTTASEQNIVGNLIELDLESQTQFGLDFDYKVDVYNVPFNIALGYFTASGQTQDETFTQHLKNITVADGIAGDTTSPPVLGTGPADPTTLTPEAESRSSELRIGARKYKDFNNGISIFYGLGLASMTYEVEGKYVKNGVQGVTVTGTPANSRDAVAASLVDFSETGSTVGIYGEIATLYKVSQQFHVGAKLDFSSGTVDIENPLTQQEESTQIGGMSYSLFAGMAF